jgi:ABC-type glycerol-3-phosphate transport system substrate-binding protein
MCSWPGDISPQDISTYTELGGWQLGINTFSSLARQDAAWEFIQYMLQPEAQKMGAIAASWAMALQSLYEDQEVLQNVPFYRDLLPILRAAVPRPAIPSYASISTIMQFSIHQALLKKMTATEALNTLAEELKKQILPVR